VEWELVLKSISVSCICPTGDKAQVRLHGVASSASDSARASDPRSRDPIDSGPCMVALFTKAAYTFGRMKFRCGFASQTNGAQEACATVCKPHRGLANPIDISCDHAHRRSSGHLPSTYDVRRGPAVFVVHEKESALSPWQDLLLETQLSRAPEAVRFIGRQDTPRTNAA
jgi:hypothetical protein